MKKTLIMKFGGASVATPEHFGRIAEIIIERQKEYRVVAVVSAMGNTTDQLIALAKQVNPDPPRREYDMLVTVGERISIALLVMAIAAKGHEAVSFTGSQSGIITCARHSDARIINVKPELRILPILNKDKAVIVAGFQGVSRGGEITTLGRGGSDTTAVALGIALNASKVEFFKDVPGIFVDDPKKNATAKMFSHLTYEEALDIVLKGAKVLHSRCIELAQKNHLLLHVRSFNDVDFTKEEGTLIGNEDWRPTNSPQYEEEC
jgi:aspartate kinase